MQNNLLTELKSIKEELNRIHKAALVEMITEGVDDPGILKCVFMAGGPGSGKTYTANDIFGVDVKFKSTFSSAGLKVVGSDIAFEKLLKDNGIDPRDLAKIEKDDPELWKRIMGKPDGIREKAKALTQKQKAFYEAGRLGLIVDGTGEIFNKVKKQRDHAYNLGYDVAMVFVNTSLDVAMARNSARERRLPDALVQQIWKHTQENMGKFQSLFGSRFFHIIDNTVYGPVSSHVQKAVNRFISAPVYNPIGKKWIASARALKNANFIK